MPEAAIPVAPASPPVANPTVFDPLNPVAPKPASPEDDPNHLIRQMIENRASKKPAEPAKADPAKPIEPAKPAAPVADPVAVPAENKKLGDLIAKSLGFKQKKAEKTAEPAQPAAVADPVEPVKPAEPPKSIVSKRKQAAQPQDPVAIATAAATAALKAVTPRRELEQPKPVEQDTLKDVDRHELTVAKYLSDTNPKYNGAEKIILDHIKKAESYAARWEQQNPGKIFDPEDEDHNDFYETLAKPWSDHEFKMAEMELAAERVEARKSKGSKAKIDALEQDHAVIELMPATLQTFQTAAVHLASGIGEEVYKKISTESFDKFAESDPIAAAEIGATLQTMHPLIDAIIQIDEPKGRIKYNENNPVHQQWANLLMDKEAQYAGAKDDNGNTFVSRAEWSEMNPAQRRGKVYLTADHLIAELVADSIEETKTRIEKERKRHEKIAESLGYTKAGAAVVTNGHVAKPREQPVAPAKPVSPSDPGSSRIDAPGDGGKLNGQRLLEATGSILFRR